MTTGVASGVEEILNDAVANGVVPGAVFAVTGPDGDAALLTAGVMRAGDGEPATTATMFRVMSMTKALGGNRGMRAGGWASRRVSGEPRAASSQPIIDPPKPCAWFIPALVCKIATLGLPVCHRS